MPPRLNIAWKRDMVGSPSCFSTPTAWALIATSLAPAIAPYAHSAANSERKLERMREVRATMRSQRLCTARPACCRTVRLPNRMQGSQPPSRWPPPEREAESSVTQPQRRLDTGYPRYPRRHDQSVDQEHSDHAPPGDPHTAAPRVEWGRYLQIDRIKCLRHRYARAAISDGRWRIELSYRSVPCPTRAERIRGLQRRPDLSAFPSEDFFEDRYGYGERILTEDGSPGDLREVRVL